MDLRARMWIQLGGAVLFAALALAEVTGLKAPTFNAAWGTWVLVGGCAVMLFEAWRTRRKWKAQSAVAGEGPAGKGMKSEKEVTG